MTSSRRAETIALARTASDYQRFAPFWQWESLAHLLEQLPDPAVLHGMIDKTWSELGMQWRVAKRESWNRQSERDHP